MAYLTFEPQDIHFGFDAPDRQLARRQFRMSLFVLGCFGLASACLILV
ncbi:MAG: hypothetical protein KGM42_03530 [Hyphomicrobiales bacterium]|nr:hypothetical protein [Hyphomicrobiales bacterium]